MIETICDIMKDAYTKGWITVRDGNASVRTAGQDYFFITPANQRKNELQPAMFKKVNLAGEDLPHTLLSSNLPISGELPLHLGLQQKLPRGVDNRVVIHLHPTYILTAMRMGIDLSTIGEEFAELSNWTRVGPTIPDYVGVKNEALGEMVCESLGLTGDGEIFQDVVGLKNHGVVAVDVTPRRAFEHIERLEHICQIIVLSARYK